MADEKENDTREILKVMVSSTIADLPKHRDQVRDACLRQGMFPSMMENLPPSDAEAIGVSLGMVDDADIYIGVFAHRYGYIPEANNPGEISVTEMEYNRAIQCGIPRLIFVMDKTHPVTFDDVEQGEGGAKLKIFLEKVKTENIVKFFTSAEDLRGHVVHGLSKLRIPDLGKFHPPSEVPNRAETYIAHPYTLLQTHGLVGRQQELNLLTKWVADPNSDVYKARTLSVIAIGGMGKSALTWKWFNDIAPQEMKGLSGRLWWSFYESDASFENFIIRALAYVSGRQIEDIKANLSPPDREMELLNILDKEPFLLVLDGLERILIAYARMDAAYLSDNDYDQATANFVAKAYGLPESAAKSFTGEHRLRQTADPRAGAFLRRLSQVKAARILISTRLYPFDLQRMDASPMPGCFALFLPGLSNDDALNLWRAFGVSGSHDQFVPIFNSFGNHALLIQALASEVANYRPAPGDFEKWKDENPNFNPTEYLHIEQAMGHVLEYALRGLGERERGVLQMIAGFRMPTGYETLSAVLVGEEKTCKSAAELDAALAELEDRGLIGWDRRANRYDLHPIVRGVVWGGLGDQAKEGVYTSLQSHFESVPMIEDWEDVESLDDLSPAIELYYTMIGLGRFDDAFLVFRGRVEMATLYRLSASRQRVELLEMLFPDGTNMPPRLSSQRNQSYTLNALAQGYQLSGQPERAVPLFRRSSEIDQERGDYMNFAVDLGNLSSALRSAGGLREAEEAARQALEINRRIVDRIGEPYNLFVLGLTLAVRGEAEESKGVLDRSLRIWVEKSDKQAEGLVNASFAQRAVWLGEYDEAARLANRSSELAHVRRGEWDIIRAGRLEGESALGLGERERAAERLHHALTRARQVNLVEEELPALTALAELKRRQGDEKAAREFLDDVWEFAERGPYPLFHADALNVLAQIERDAGNTDAAIEAATEAYKKSWCDGPPYAYHWGLEKAKKHLTELEAPFPEMPPFDESKFEPMPDVEIDPEAEEEKGSGGEEE